MEKIEPGEAKGRVAEKEPGPSVAIVRVVEVLKGRCGATHVKVGSGPIRSCAPWDVHFSFTLNETRVFILPAQPHDGSVSLEFGGSMPHVEATSLVKSRLAGARSYRDRYLERAARDQPELHKAGVALAEEMRAAAWPRLPLSPGGRAEESREFSLAKERLVRRLSTVDIESIRLALAIDWLDEGRDPWWRRDLWLSAARVVEEKRRGDIVACDREWIRRTLRDGRVTDELAQAYVDALGADGYAGDLDFPPRPPRLHEPKDGAVLTTDFILRGLAYSRGDLVRAYGMALDELSRLDPTRVQTLVPALYGDDDEVVRNIGRRVIQYAPGDAFVGPVLRRTLDEADAWRALKHPTDARQTATRLRAMVTQSATELTPWGRARLWKQLQRAGCFEEPCLDAAIAALERCADDEHDLRDSLHAYLRGAMEERSRDGATEMSPGEYRSWFRAHPPRKE